MIAVSLGWGWQSFTLVSMVAFGELPPIDAAIHADTTHEREDTHRFAERWTPWLEDRGVKVVTVQDKSPTINTSRPGGEIFIPAYTAGSYIDLSGNRNESRGVLRRQCTGRWKIKPIRRWLQSNRNKQPVELWLGISLDEYQRMKDSDVKYITHRWPLIEKRMTRQDCLKWLQAHNLEVPPKSSCVFCPYHNRAGWQDVKRNPADWEKAVAVDEAIRKARPPYDLFVHAARIPLVDVDLRTPQEKGQLDLWANWEEECSGICGV